MKAEPQETQVLRDDLRSLYQDIILDHGKHPRNFRVVEHHTCKAQGNNPMCGDRVTVTARVEGGKIEDVAFEGKGCAISIASASMMTDALRGHTPAAARALAEAVRDICTGKDAVLADEALAPHMEKLAALSGVRQFPVRVKCATLPWHALLSCLDSGGPTTTEK
ncbi:MAG: Fe-S cluster assembly sulfur transfer protein SufU [Rhodospirillaceae bacterium]